MNNQNGYIALTSTLIIGALIVVVGLSVSLTSIGNLLNSYAFGQSSDDLYTVESCVEDVLLRLNETGSIPGSISLSGATCSVTINSQIGSTWDFTVTRIGTNTKQVRVVATRGSSITISSWNEL